MPAKKENPKKKSPEDLARRTFSLTEAQIELIQQVRDEEDLKSESAAVRRLISNGAAFRRAVLSQWPLVHIAAYKRRRIALTELEVDSEDSD